MTQQNGTVKWFNTEKAFGFIVSNGKDYFVHKKAIISGEDKLIEGQSVTFTPKDGSKGEQASLVSVIEPNGNI